MKFIKSIERNNSIFKINIASVAEAAVDLALLDESPIFGDNDDANKALEHELRRTIQAAVRCPYPTYILIIFEQLSDNGVEIGMKFHCSVASDQFLQLVAPDLLPPDPMEPTLGPKLEGEIGH